MTRNIGLVAIILASTLAAPKAKAIRYNVEPVALSNGYAITGGFIETGITGAVMGGDITDYQVIVDGAVPHTFTPDGPWAAVHVRGTVLATDTELVIPVVPDVATNIHGMIFTSMDNTHPDCDDCAQWISIDNVLDLTSRSAWRYRIHDDADPRPPNTPGARGNLFIVPQARIVVATVPEPSTVTMIFLGVCVFATTMKRKA